MTIALARVLGPEFRVTALRRLHRHTMVAAGLGEQVFEAHARPERAAPLKDSASLKTSRSS